MRVLAVAAALLLVGCLAQLDASPSQRTEALDPVLVHPAVAISKETPGGEPVVAVASDGTLYAQGIGSNGNSNVNSVWRSDDGGLTWVDITPPAEGRERSNDGFVAVGNGRSVYVANVFQTTFQLFRSDDKGAAWTKLKVPRVPLLMHRHWIVPVGESTVHLAIEAFPPGFAPYLARLPAPEQGQGTPNEGMWYARSDDKGATWTTPVQIDPLVNFAGQGQLVVSSDGERLYVPRYQDDEGAFTPLYVAGQWYLLASEDGGDTWERRDMMRLTSELSTAVPPLALDEAGTLYFTWTQEAEGKSRLRLSRSRDGGSSWSDPVEVGSLAGTQAMAWSAAPGPAGHLSVLWFEADADGTASKVNASWSVKYARIMRADTGTPVSEVATLAEGVHEGNICARGPACGPGEDRRLLDYPWMVFGPDGAANAVYPSTAWEKPSAFAMFSKVEPMIREP